MPSHHELSQTMRGSRRPHLAPDDRAPSLDAAIGVSPAPDGRAPLSAPAVIALQRTAGNAATVRALQRAAATEAPAAHASPVSADNLAQMHADADFIVARLKQQVLAAEEEQSCVDRVRAWADWDRSFTAGGGQGSPFLDRFLTILRTRTFSRATARMLFGLAGDEWLNAYDGLFYELEDDRLAQFKAIVAASGKGTAGPETQQTQSVYGYVGKRVGLGAWGILKQMGLAVMSLADAMVWAQWRSQGMAGDPPQLAPAVAAQFDDAAKVLADMAKDGATPEEMEREKREMMDEYGFGDRWGKIVGILMTAGMGSAGQAVKAVSTAAQIAQGGQGAEMAARKIAARVEAMSKRDPKATWREFLADDEVRLELGNGLAALVGVVGAMAGDEGATAEFLKRFHLLVDATVLTPLLKKAWMDYNDPKLALDPTARQHALESDVATIVGTVAAMVGGKLGAKSGKAKPDEEAPGPVTSPDEMPNVLLVEVTPAQLEQLLVELESSTPTGVEIARRVRSGELQLTLGRDAIAPGAVGLAMPNEVHVQWDGSLQDIAGTLIHEAVHQGDPGLAGGAPRSQVEATARVAEFEYRAARGLAPRDPVETSYRATLDQGPSLGLTPEAAQARARQAMIDMMQADPGRHGVEAADGSSQTAGPAKSPASPEEELLQLIRDQAADRAQGDVGLTDVDPAERQLLDLPEYQSGIATASDLFAALPDPENAKNVASGPSGTPELSGWGDGGIDATERAQREGEEAGHETEPSVFDPEDAPGQYESSHSERKRAAGTSDQEFASSKPLCPACQRWFSARAGLEGRPQFVGDPGGVHVFSPNGAHSLQPHPSGAITHD
jgi:hypothetical protein